MASEHHSQSKVELYESGLTVPSDSENYSAHQDLSSSSSSSSPLILYQPPTLWSLLRGAAINLFLPFVNGLMLGFGELFAHEAAFRLGWSGTKVRMARMGVLGGSIDVRLDVKQRQSLISFNFFVYRFSRPIDDLIPSVLGWKCGICRRGEAVVPVWTKRTRSLLR